MLGAPSVAFTRQVVDIPLPKARVTEHVFFKRWCTNCRTRFYPKTSLKGVTVGKQRFGINLTSFVTTLSEEFRQPLNKIKSFLKMTYDLEISEGGIVKLLETTSKNGQGKCEEIKTKLRESDVVYADETGSREAGINGYQWSFSNDKYQLVWYHKRRNKKVVRKFVGEENKKRSFEGVLVSDFLASYNEYNGFHQRCWVHLLRDIKNLQSQVGNKHPPLNIWAKKIRQIYKEAKDWPGPDQNLPLGLQTQERIKKEACFKEKLKGICEPYITKDTPMSTLSARAIIFLPELFTFVRFEGINPDNNMAERALRHSVIKRKISGGTRSEKGSRTREVLASLFGTWRLQGLNPLRQTRLMLARAPCQEV
jgi:transposase